MKSNNSRNNRELKRPRYTWGEKNRKIIMKTPVKNGSSEIDSNSAIHGNINDAAIYVIATISVDEPADIQNIKKMNISS